jgi:hypothetical protein
MGERTDKGYKPKTYVNPKTKKHVYDFLKEGRDYADWTSPNIVIRKANLFFKDGKPYKNHLISITQDIQDMKTLRNAIVHISKESQEKFKTLVRKRFGYAKTMITPGEFLSTPVKNKNLVYISYFRNQLEFVSDKLVR